MAAEERDWGALAAAGMDPGSKYRPPSKKQPPAKKRQPPKKAVVAVDPSLQQLLDMGFPASTEAIYRCVCV